MAGQKKFGFFAGVFTPSLLTILGVIMYMRLGWVVGHAGLTGSIIIILIAHVISVATGLSISSIATNKKVGPGGVYYVLSRSLGLPMGGAIGFTLFIATSFSIALYLIGFAENFNPVLGMGSSINDFRVSGTLALLLLTILVYVSTSVAIKSQYFILAAIVLSLVSVFLGNADAVNLVAPTSSIGSEVSFGLLFGIFFPAVTGFTAGIAMSGDLGNPKKDIPVGTMLAIGAGLIVYLVLAIFLSVYVSEAQLQSNYNILMDIALFSPLVIAGIWGATLSSALGGLLGGPRIFQAMSVDRITPFSKIFANGVGNSNEPRNALILTIIIAEVGVLIGELDSIARLVSMFYLMAYNFINLSFFLESWANSDFSPKFKVSKWVGAIGFLATFTVMFQIDPVAMVMAYVLLFGLYFYLKRKEMSLSSGDIWGSVWSSVVKTGLKKMDGMEEHQNYWRPNILLFSGGTNKRPHLIEFSHDLGGRTGMISNFDLIETPDSKVMFPKHEKSLSVNVDLPKGIFTRVQEVKDIYSGIETIASIYGFSGIEPNTILMGWPRKTNHAGRFAQLTQSLIDLDYNVLYLDYDDKRGYGAYQTIDLWWRGISNNVVLTVKLVKFLTSSQRWANANVRILLVNDNAGDRIQIKESIASILNEYRLSAEIKIINNTVEKLSIYELMKHYSILTDLVFVGIPDTIEDEDSFVANTNNLVENIGTTLLVRASSQFTETRLGVSAVIEAPKEELKIVNLGPLRTKLDSALNKRFVHFENELFEGNRLFVENTVYTVTQSYILLFEDYKKLFQEFFSAVEMRKGNENFKRQFSYLQEQTALKANEFIAKKRAHLTELINSELVKWMKFRKQLFSRSPETVKRMLSAHELEVFPKDSFDIKWIKREQQLFQKIFDHSSIALDWNDMMVYYEATVNLQNMKKLLHDIGMIEAYNLKALRERTVVVIEHMLDEVLNHPEKRTVIVNSTKKKVSEGLLEQITYMGNKPDQILALANQRDRKMVLKMVELSEKLNVNSIIEDLEEDFSVRKSDKLRNEISDYPIFWERNQNLFANLFKTGMISAGLHVEFVYLKEKVGHDVRANMFGLFKRISKHYNGLITPDKLIDIDQYSHFEESELLNYNPSEFLSRVHEELRFDIRSLPDSVDILNENSILNFNDFQESEVELITIDLQKIADYYIELDFIEPVNRKITRIYNEVSSKFEDIGNRISYIIELKESQQDEADIQVDQLTNKLLVDINGLKESISKIENDFNSFIDQQFIDVSSKLSISELLTSSSSQNRFVHIKSGYKGFSEKWLNLNKRIQNWVANSAVELRKKRYQLRVAEFKEQNKTLVNKRAQFRDFVIQNSLSDSVLGTLPTYYRHLFSGKQVFSNQLAINRFSEMNQALETINSGVSGGLLVVGEPLAGKSHFVETLIQTINPPRIVRISSPINGVNKKTTLLGAFREATGIEGSYFNIMNQLQEGTVFTFYKLERWWIRKSGGERFIDELVGIIEKYGRQHKFVMAMNIFAYDLVRQVSKLDSILSSTILLPPANAHEMAEIMFDRHKIAGVRIQFSERKDLEISKRDVLSRFDKIAQGAKGNIGVTMLRWLSSIEFFEDNVVVVKQINDKGMPSDLSKKWAIILLHLVLHDRLNLDNLVSIFSVQDKELISSVIKELHDAELISQISKNTYSVNPYMVKWVIENLVEQNYLRSFE